MNSILKVTDLTKLFYPPLTLGRMARLDFRRGEAVKALDGVSFSLERGKVLCVLGPNGAGKTTLLKILSTLIIPDSGTATIGGSSLGKDDERIKKTIGLSSFQDRSFYWRLTGRQNLEFYAALYGLGAGEASARIKELFGQFEITYGDKRFDSYSTGMMQKFTLMRALIHDPELLFLDEPTKSLDYPSSLKLMSFLKEELAGGRGKAVIFTTHHLDEAAAFADLHLVLNKGKAKVFGALDRDRLKKILEDRD